jgi:hypothetical protein
MHCTGYFYVLVLVLVELRACADRPVRFRAKPLETHDQYFFQLKTCCYSPYVTFSLTRGWFCCLQLLLGIASAVILKCESHGTHDYILRSQIRDSPTCSARSSYLYPPGTRWPSYNTRHWVPFSSPLTTRRATVELFDPASCYRASARTEKQALSPTAHLVLCLSSAADSC